MAKLIGEISTLKCLSGYTVTVPLDADTQVGIVDHFWKQKFLPERQVGDKEINLTAANGERILYDRWVELTVRST